MNLKNLDSQVSVSEQISLEELTELADIGVEVLVCNRPDDESIEQIAFSDIYQAASNCGIEAVHLPFSPGGMTTSHRNEFINLIKTQKRIHAFCRTGNRSSTLWALAQRELGMLKEHILSITNSAGIDVAAAFETSEPQETHSRVNGKNTYDIVIVGAGSAGIGVAASLLKRKAKLRIALLDEATEHFYQPGWTMVGGGVFDPASTCRKTIQLIPKGATWIQKNVITFSPEEQKVTLTDGSEIHYEHLIVSPGLKLDWTAIEGLSETLGRNGVTSNYRYDLAPYTWKLVQELKKGKAIFTQPPMPIKCAGAPQKALYLSADHWFRQDNLDAMNIHFYNSGAVLFGVEAYVPTLMSYIEKYNANLHFGHTLCKVDGNNRRAWFKKIDHSGKERIIETDFNFLHVCPPQCAPDFIRQSTLSDDAGWLDVDQYTLRHQQFANIWGLGDVMNTPNAKTMAAARMQVPVVAENICNILEGDSPTAGYNGYGSCPLTVERGKIVLAEFSYGGKLSPTFPDWINNGIKPTKRAWFLKAQMLPTVYWHGMLKGREWFVSPKKLET